MNTEVMHAMLIKILLFLELFIGLSAIIGGSALIVTNGLGLPVGLLHASPFTSYFWPGLILIGMVGGIHITAAILVLQHTKYYLEISALAGFILLSWIIVEVSIIARSNTLNLVYFCLSFIVLFITRTLSIVRSGR